MLFKKVHDNQNTNAKVTKSFIGYVRNIEGIILNGYRTRRKKFNEYDINDYHCQLFLVMSTFFIVFPNLHTLS
jgi:hypothetical protein